MTFDVESSDLTKDPWVLINTLATTNHQPLATLPFKLEGPFGTLSCIVTISFAKKQLIT